MKAILILIIGLSFLDNNGLDKFWNELRKAIIEKDKSTIAQLTMFPLTCYDCGTFADSTNFNSIDSIAFLKTYIDNIFDDKIKRQLFLNQNLKLKLDKNFVCGSLSTKIIEKYSPGNKNYTIYITKTKPKEKNKFDEGSELILTIKTTKYGYKLFSICSIP